MSNAKIIIKYNGKRYRVCKWTGCASKRDCSLFEAGVCNNDGYTPTLPCDDICNAFIAICGSCPKYCYKEIKK